MKTCLSFLSPPATGVKLRKEMAGLFHPLKAMCLPFSELHRRSPPHVTPASPAPTTPLPPEYWRPSPAWIEPQAGTSLATSPAKAPLAFESHPRWPWGSHVDVCLSPSVLLCCSAVVLYREGLA